MAVAGGIGLVLGVMLPGHRLLAAGLQTGLLDPIPLVYRSVSLVVLPLLAPGGGNHCRCRRIADRRCVRSGPGPLGLASPVLLPVCLSVGGLVGDCRKMVFVADGATGHGR